MLAYSIHEFHSSEVTLGNHADGLSTCLSLLFRKTNVKSNLMVYSIQTQFPISQNPESLLKLMILAPDSTEAQAKQLQENVFIVSILNPATDLHLHSWALHSFFLLLMPHSCSA